MPIFSCCLKNLVLRKKITSEAFCRHFFQNVYNTTTTGPDLNSMYLDPQQWQHCENFFFYNNDLFSAKRAMGTESVSLPIEKNPCRGFCSAILSPDGPLTRTNIWRKYHQIRAGRKSLKCFRVCAHFQTASRLKSSLTFPQKISRIPGFASSYLLAFFSALDSRTPSSFGASIPHPDWRSI